MIFEEIHTQLYAIANIDEEDTFMTVIPRRKRKTRVFGNIPKNGSSISNSNEIKSNNAVQLSLFS